MKEHTFDTVDASTSAAAPHFDDELTLLSARQVVPLQKIDARARHRRQWFLGGAFALAMMLGAASALLASYLQLRTANNQENGITQVELATAPLAAEENPTSEPAPIASLEEQSEPPVTLETPRKEPTIKRSFRREPDFVPSRSTSGVSEEDELERIRDAVLYEEWQERRQRRVTRRDRRRAEPDSRDLSNLDEIFEGRRRP